MLTAAAPRRTPILIAIFLIICAFILLSSSHTPRASTTIAALTPSALQQQQQQQARSPLTHGSPIAPKLGNETAKAELGRASWKLFHTIMARFPDKPSADESAALRDYIYLFQRLYPCGECAEHFRKILEEFPPQTSSRSSAAVWACHVHNEVNKSLKKEIFDCANIGDFYDCGCADDDGKKTTATGKG
jgi:FAD-linked sulfhydryl oxidase